MNIIILLENNEPIEQILCSDKRGDYEFEKLARKTISDEDYEFLEKKAVFIENLFDEINRYLKPMNMKFIWLVNVKIKSY